MYGSSARTRKTGFALQMALLDRRGDIRHARAVSISRYFQRTTTRLEREMTRISYKKIVPGAYQAMLGLERCVRESALEHSLLELVRTRASQLNGCAFCLDMHSKDAIAAGETPQRLLVLSAWRDAPFYTERERAALAWTEAITQLGPSGVPDELYR